MCSFHSFIEELYNNTKIPFNIELDGDDEVAVTLIENVDFENIYIPIDIGHKKGKIITTKNYESCAGLLKYLVESKLKEIYISKEEILLDILEGKSVNIELIKNNIPVLVKDFSLVTIFLENSHKECLEIIEAVYGSDNIVSMIYKNHIVIVGVLEDIDEHVISLRDSITTNIFSSCYIGYNRKLDIEALPKAFEDSINKIALAIKYDLPERIYAEDTLLFEQIVDSIDDKIKNNIYINFNEGFSKLDAEMTKTIDVFFECGLNISDASKELYVHRNTLIYRLDKIQKFTKSDIRDFNEAVIFKIAFLIWKERQKR